MRPEEKRLNQSASKISPYKSGMGQADYYQTMQNQFENSSLVNPYM